MLTRFPSNNDIRISLTALVIALLLSILSFCRAESLLSGHDTFDDINAINNISQTDQSTLSTEIGFSRGGTFISRGNSIVFIEGLSQSDLYGIAYQSLWGGLLPGLILGARPFINHWLLQNGITREAQSAFYWMLTGIGHLPHYAAKFTNLPNIINAGVWYAIPSLFSEGIHHYEIYKPGSTPMGTGFLAQALGMSGSLLLSRLHMAITGEHSGQQIHLPGEDGRNFFIQIRNSFAESNQTAIEIQRVKSSETVSPLAHSPLGQLAQAMDKAGSDILILLPQTTPVGNRLHLAFAANKPTQENMKEEQDFQVHLSNIDLNLGSHRYTPWLETSIPEPGWFGKQTEIPNSTYISVFQQDILNAISEALPCITTSECSTGLVQSSTNSNYTTYVSHKNRITKAAISQKNVTETNDSHIFDLSGNLYFNIQSGELYLNSYHSPSTITQYWVPSWVNNFVIAEVTAAIRNTAMTLPQAGLYHLASTQGLSTRPPQNLADIWNAQVEAYENIRRTRRQRALRRTRRFPIYTTENTYPQPAASTEPATTYAAEPPTFNANADPNYEYLQEKPESYFQYQDRIRAIYDPVNNWEPGKVMLVQQGLDKEAMTSAQKEAADRQRRMSRNNDPKAPVSYATFEAARTDIRAGKRVTVDEYYEAPLYAGGIVGGLQPATPEAPPCIYCEEGPEAAPQFTCNNPSCLAGSHLHCLDRYFRFYVRELGGKDINIAKRQLNTDMPCPNCQGAPLHGEAKWFEQNNVNYLPGVTSRFRPW